MSESNVFSLSAYRDRQQALTERTRRIALTVTCPWSWCAQPPGERCVTQDIDGQITGVLGDEYAAHTLRIRAAMREIEQGGHGA